MPATAYSTAPTVTYVCVISREFKSDSVNDGKQMCWIFVGNAVNFAVIFCKKWGGLRWIIFFCRIHRISYINLPQNSMRSIFVRYAMNFAVNFCKKCVEMRWIFCNAFTAFTVILTLICHKCRCDEFSKEIRWNSLKYLSSPHSTRSPHFLQKFSAFTAFLTKIYPKTTTREVTSWH